MAVREESCADSELKKDRLGVKIDDLKVVVMKFGGERGTISRIWSR